MTTPDFPARLRALGLSRRGFARLISELSGRPAAYRTVERWGTKIDPPDAALALVALLETNTDLISADDIA